MTSRWTMVLAAASILVASSASAQNLLVNGDFETGDLTGWTLSTWQGPPDRVIDYGVTVRSALSGSFGLSGGIPDAGLLGTPNMYFSQVLATVPGRTYRVSGQFLKSFANPDNECANAKDGGDWHFNHYCSATFLVSFTSSQAVIKSTGNVFAMPMMDFDYSVGQMMSFTTDLVASTAKTELQVLMWTQKNYLFADNFSVTVVSEPGSATMVIAGLLALGCDRYRRRRPPSSRS